MLMESDILYAMQNTKSNAAAARFLKVSLPTFRKYAKMYKNEEGIDLYEAHKNESGKGVLRSKKYQTTREQLIDGTHKLPKQRLKYLLLQEALLEEKCSKCGFDERRFTDHTVPLMLVFEDGDKENRTLSNLNFYCFNCAYLYVGNVFGRPHNPEKHL